MLLPKIAIVGRPNVGKSSLLNMLAQEKVSIVDPTPGVTRDRVSVVVELPDYVVPENIAALACDPIIEVIDTGGLGVYTAPGEQFDDAGQDLTVVTLLIEQQIQHAVDEANLILFVVDVQAGVSALDESVADLLRRAMRSAEHPPSVLVIANKVDSESWEPHALDAAALGMGEPFLLAARTNRGRKRFLETLAREIPLSAWSSDAARDPRSADIRIAIVGKRNAGKSTFVNTLAGEDRVIVSELAGATRDAVDVRFEFDGKACVAIDTAGFRRQRSTTSRIEWWARDRALRSVERADVTLLLVDATTPLSHIDKRLGAAVVAAFKPCVLVVNKWDLAAGERNRGGQIVNTDDYRKYIDKQMPGLRRAPIVFTSAATGKGVRDAIDVAFDLHAQANTRVSTGKLNRIVHDVIESGGSGSAVGVAARIYFATQVAVAPPTIILVVNDPEAFSKQNMRFLTNRLAASTPFEEVPVRLLLRPRKRVDLAELKRRAHAAETDTLDGARDEQENTQAKKNRQPQTP